jgi:hypothetical protein
MNEDDLHRERCSTAVPDDWRARVIGAFTELRARPKAWWETVWGTSSSVKTPSTLCQGFLS